MKTWMSVALWVFVCLLQKGDAAISAWAAPTVIGTTSGSASLSFAENVATGTGGVSTTFSATGAGTITYTLLTSTTFFTVSGAGVLSLDTALDFETTTSHVIEIQAVDADPTTGTATITITVTDVNEAPAFAASVLGFCHASGTAAGTTVTTLTATDQDAGDTVTLSLTAGNGAGDFTFTAASGLLVVASGKTLQTSTTAGYALTFEAVDNDGTPLTGTTTLIILVPSACGASAALIASLGLVLLMSFITLLK